MHIKMYPSVMPKAYSVSDTKANLPEILDEVEAGKDVRLGRRGRKENVNMATTADEIERTAQEYAAAWSSGDAKAAAEFFTEDAVRVDAAGAVQQGRAEIQAALDALVHRTLSAPKITLAREAVRILTPDLALWRGGMEIATTDGAPALKGNAVLLMRQEAGRWLVLEAHAKLYPPPRA